ncbi:MAG: hypothetical protein HRU12_07535 [Phaeodactylibacter sp.]|nr:hypothetical protein [Phaeodactylibacter sp.]
MAGYTLKYVYVVCGAASHIQLLHLSIRLLQKHSKAPIIVVTDRSRNAIAIEHDRIIDIKTPGQFSNHEAAIYLKTGLAKWLNPQAGAVYCYLDTDVFAVSKTVDAIVDHFHPPITFAQDHCDIFHFSPNAINDPWTNQQLENVKLLTDLYKVAQELDQQQRQKHPELIGKILEIKARFHENRPLHTFRLSEGESLIKMLQIFTSKVVFQVARFWHRLFPFKNAGKRTNTFESLHQSLFGTPFDFRAFAGEELGLLFHAATSTWRDKKGAIIFEENLIHDYVNERTTFQWNDKDKVWKNNLGQTVEWPGSNLLKGQIKKDFQVEIEETHWRHWNGGVFLFSEAAIPFLNQWHDWTLAIFDNPSWKTRDQGTLAAVAWDNGLANHPTLPVAYNLIADYYTKDFEYLGNFEFKDKCGRLVLPKLLHIYNETGNQSWQLWQDVEELAL